ncbi:MAG TPA: prolyl oligopeptidase family serine peptidase [Phycisphaerae bacterium]|nr:prolyl oligopeptidase family serine peptidase [Phycisphaerae bacterium]
MIEFAVGLLLVTALMSQQPKDAAPVRARKEQAWSFQAASPAEAEAWRARARPVLTRMLGLDRIEPCPKPASERVTLGEPQDMGAYTRQDGRIRTEPDVEVPFWFLRPKGQGPFPVAVLPHGHDEIGRDTYTGIARDDGHAEKIHREDRDVAVQAAERGFVAIAPVVRGFGELGIAAGLGRADSKCVSTWHHHLLRGRVLIGARVWDVMRILDWALELPYVDPQRVLVMGNSGGGVVTSFAAACDTRIKVAVASCSFCSFVGVRGQMHHHPCNIVPGILEFGEFWDVHGLVAPRHLLFIHGEQDRLFPADEVTRAVEKVRRIYRVSGAGDRFAQRSGPAGHRFYKDLIWPFVEAALRR